MSLPDDLVIEGEPTPAHEAAIKAALEAYLADERPPAAKWPRPEKARPGRGVLSPRLAGWKERPLRQPGWKAPPRP